MKKLILFFVLVVVLSIVTASGCGLPVTATPAPSPVNDVPPAPAVAVSPTIVAGSLADFYAFAANIAAAISARDASFFGEQASPQGWNCLGDEMFGVCQGHPSGDVLKGVPVTHEWQTYSVYQVSDYKGLWQAAFAQGDTLMLAAVASRWGDNPLMPMAEQSFMAVITAAGHGAQAPIREVHVLFFEYSERSWHLEGELVTREHVEDWLTDACLTCYDNWMAWSK